MDTSETNVKYGQRLIPPLIDETAQQDPTRVFAQLPLRQDFKGGLRDITFSMLARAINRCAWWMHDIIGNSDSFETIMYMGPGDLSAFIAVLAAIKTGHKMLLCPPSQPLETVLSLCERTQCQLVWTSTPESPRVQELLSGRPMTKMTALTLQGWLEDGDDRPYPYTKLFLEAQNNPFVVCITSGSTGIPKPIVMKHGTMTHHDLFTQNQRLGGNPIGLAQLAGKRVFLGMPLFHSAGVCFMVYAIYSNTILVLPPAAAGPGLSPITPAIADAAHATAKVNASFLNPIIITAISQNEQYLENLRGLEYLTFGGAALPREVGNKIKDHVHLFVSFGATETGYYALELTERDDWEYAQPSKLMGYDFRHLGDGKHELYFVRRPELRDHQGMFWTFDDANEFTLKDVYSKHPTRENLWLYQGRSDDLLVLANGARLNPLEYEGRISVSPLVSAALMYGSRRPRTGLIVEPSEHARDNLDEQELLARLWPLIAGANRTVSHFVQVSRDMVIVAPAAKPFLRAGKGSVRRKVTFDLYADEIEARYRVGLS